LPELLKLVTMQDVQPAIDIGHWWIPGAQPTINSPPVAVRCFLLRPLRSEETVVLANVKIP
jgi:hypothetical protein